MTWLALIENNNWEGETWTFFFPVPDDEMSQAVELAELLDHCSELEIDVDTEYEERDIDVLIRHDPERGYMAAYHKLDPLDFTRLLEMSGEDLASALYKGGIQEFQLD